MVVVVTSGGARTDVVRLGLRAGVPDVVAVADTAEVLGAMDPTLAGQCEEPSSPQEEWPGAMPKGFKRLDRTYAALVDKAVGAGLIELGDPDDVVRVGGEVAEQSAFAVSKGDHEDRWISSMVVTNALVDRNHLRCIHLPYMPQLATVTTQRGRKLLLSKRDPLHYFHVENSWRILQCARQATSDTRCSIPGRWAPGIQQ